MASPVFSKRRGSFLKEFSDKEGGLSSAVGIRLIDRRGTVPKEGVRVKGNSTLHMRGIDDAAAYSGTRAASLHHSVPLRLKWDKRARK